jgi:peptide/nickel transport system permease protein
VATTQAALAAAPRAIRRRRPQLNASLVVGGIVVLAATVLGLLAPVLAPDDPMAQDLKHLEAPPSRQHLLGTDDLGRDVLSRVLYGLRLSLAVGALATAAAVVIGSPLGLLAGYAARWVDAACMRALDAVLAFPGILLALLLVATIGPSLVTLVMALGVSYMPLFARTLRAATLGERTREYVIAAVASGATAPRILRRHILSNVAYVVWVQATLTLGLTILAEATLGYLGLGMPPEVPSLGRMILEGRTILEVAPHVALAPLTAVSFTILGFNLLGNGLADVTDPRLRLGG